MNTEGHAHFIPNSFSAVWQMHDCPDCGFPLIRYHSPVTDYRSITCSNRRCGFGQNNGAEQQPHWTGLRSIHDCH